MAKKLIIIDGYSLMYRAFYAISADMSSRSGVPTGALFGFLTMFLKLCERKPDYVLVAFDEHGPTFRHGLFDAYKAGRKPTPDELKTQIPILRELLGTMGVRCYGLESYEADDILGTVSRMAEGQGIETLLVTGDRDALQLTGELTTVMLTKRGITETVEYTPALLMENYGLKPDAMRDLKALMGDSSDNIPGVPGVGEKTALKLLGEYGSVEGVLEHAGEVKGKLGEKLRDNADLARLSYALGTIKRDVPVTIALEDCCFDFSKTGRAKARLLELDLRRIAAALPDSVEDVQKKSAAKTHVIGDMEELETVLSANKPASIALLLTPEAGFAFDEKQAYTFRHGETLLDVGVDERAALNRLAEYIKANRLPLLCFDSKTLLHKLFSDCADSVDIAFDAMIADYLLQANRPSASFDALCDARLGGAGNAASLYGLRDEMLRELDEKDMTSLYSDMEMPLMRVLFDMESIGFAVDAATLDELHERFSARVQELENSIYEMAGERFNILSTKQLGVILYDKLGLPSGKKTKTGRSTDADTLEALEGLHEIIRPILEYRFLTKLDSTFVVGLLSKRDADGRVRTGFMQCVTATGRISSTEPNLQNIPVRTEEGRKIRKAFVPSNGNILVGADYSQIELRILAHISGDEGFIAAFNSGEDIHARTAAEVFHVPIEEVSRELRSSAKAVNFGIVYGISDFGLAQNLGIPVKRAASYKERYFARYPRVKEYLESSVATAREKGYAETMFHRRRPLPELASGNFNLRAFGERVAMNMPIQGSAADIIKLAMVKVSRALKDGGYRARLVLQIHDELIIDTPPDEADAVFALVTDCMESVASLKVKLEADAKRGMSWFDTK